MPLSFPSFLGSVNDEFLPKTIRYGRPGRVMPAFKALSSAQVDAIVHYIIRDSRHIRGWSDKPALNKAGFLAAASDGMILHTLEHGLTAEGEQTVLVTLNPQLCVRIAGGAIDPIVFKHWESDLCSIFHDDNVARQAARAEIF